MFDEEYTSWARREHSNALLEVQRLESLMEDVSWYQFEIAAKGWQTPWHTSFPLRSDVLAPRFDARAHRGLLARDDAFKRRRLFELFAINHGHLVQPCGFLAEAQLHSLTPCRCHGTPVAQKILI